MVWKNRQDGIKKSRAKTGVQKPLRIGVLDIQGSVEEHLESLRRIGVEAVGVKNVAALDAVDGLILPGGESTTIGLLCEMYGLRERLVQKIRAGFPVYGTCAGAILLSQWGVLDIDVERNTYGRQIESFDVFLKCSDFGEELFGKKLLREKPLRGIFIRAPKIKKIGPTVRVIAEYDHSPVLVQEKNILASSFHPELTDDLRIHLYFSNLSRRFKL